MHLLSTSKGSLPRSSGGGLGGGSNDRVRRTAPPPPSRARAGETSLGPRGSRAAVADAADEGAGDEVRDPERLGDAADDAAVAEERRRGVAIHPRALHPHALERLLRAGRADERPLARAAGHPRLQ